MTSLRWTIGLPLVALPLMALPACEWSGTDPAADSGSGDGSSDETSGGTTDAASSRGGTDDAGDTAATDPTTGPHSTTTDGSSGNGSSDDGSSDDGSSGAASADDGSSGDGSSGDASSDDGGSSGGEGLACVTDCGNPAPGMDEDEEYGPCFSPVADCTHACVGLAQPCPTLDVWDAEFAPASFVQNAQCFLQALADDQPAQLTYSAAYNEWDVNSGAIYLLGDGLVMMDINLDGHCGNGGSYSVHPFATDALPLVADYGVASGCADAMDPETLLTCALGPSAGAEVLGFPWLDPQCVDAEASCPSA